jgi:hypothetical protein
VQLVVQPELTFMWILYLQTDRGFSPRSLRITLLATLGGFLFGYDQGVVGNVLVLESFGAKFPRVYSDSGIKVRGPPR